MNSSTAKVLFGTKQLSNQGVKMQLVDPATNKKTAHWFTVLGTDAQVFRSVRLKGQREIASKDWTKEAEGAREKALDDHRMAMTLSLVTGWSFEEPFSTEALRDLLDESPALVEQIDTFASERANFMSGGSQS